MEDGHQDWVSVSLGSVDLKLDLIVAFPKEKEPGISRFAFMHCLERIPPWSEIPVWAAVTPPGNLGCACSSGVTLLNLQTAYWIAEANSSITKTSRPPDRRASTLGLVRAGLWESQKLVP